MNQVTNGVAVRMAILYLLVARSKAEDAAETEPAAGAGARPRWGAGVSARLLVAGGRVVDPVAGTVAAEDLLLEDGRIAARGPRGHARRARPTTLDARGLAGAARAGRHARAPARAGAGVQGDDRDRRGRGAGGRLHVDRLHGEHRAR